jgi:hypothetical protein
VDVRTWRQAATRHLLPDLPGNWQVSGWAVHRDSAGWFSQAVLASISRSTLSVAAIVQFLARPKDAWIANVSLELGRWLTVPATVEDTEPVMHELAQLIPANAVPFFDEHATPEGRLSYLRRQVAMSAERTGGSGYSDVNVDEELTYVHLLRGDLDGVVEAARWTEQAAAHDGRGSAVDANNRVQRVAAAARRDPDEALKIPAPGENTEAA